MHASSSSSLQQAEQAQAHLLLRHQRLEAELQALRAQLPPQPIPKELRGCVSFNSWELGRIRPKLEKKTAATLPHKAKKALQRAARTAFLELICDASIPATHLTTWFNGTGFNPRSRSDSFARDCWEHLLETISGDEFVSNRKTTLYGKMNFLREHDLYCPRILFRQHCRLESIELMVQELRSQELVGEFMGKMFQCMKADAKSSFHQSATRDAFERVTGKLFPKVRPRFLRNPASGRNLELDGYCQELKLAFEYDGALHSTFPNSFHRTHAQFVAQQQRDVLKDQLCRNAGIRLLRVSCDVTLSDIDAHVMSLLPRSNMGTS